MAGKNQISTVVVGFSTISSSHMDSALLARLTIKRGCQLLGWCFSAWLGGVLFGCTDSGVEAGEGNPASATGAAGSGHAGAAGGGGAHAGPFEPPVVEWPDPQSGDPFWLSQTGLYLEIETDEFAPDLIAFEPAHVLWTDAATKRRWLRLPAGTTIDTSNPDHWQLPVGAVLFKEFTRDGTRVETRAIARLGPDRFDYWMGAFVWNDDNSDAVFTPLGQANARQTEHDVPTVKQCGTCHNGEPTRALGFSAIQLSAGGGASLLASLAKQGVLSHPPEAPEDFEVPGDPVTAAALGYLHANCGHCHNPNGSARPDTNMNLRLDVGQRTPEATNTYQSTIGVELQYFVDTALEFRVVAGDPDQSALIERMSERGTDTQMPPFATELSDPKGIELVEAWIQSLD